MSDHPTLQRLVVRLLYDPALVADLRADPPGVTGPLGLSPAAVGWLMSVDPRAWGIDTMRRSRTLTALLEEFPATAALAFQRPDAAAVLDDFFSDGAFHEAIEKRRALAPAFGGWWRGAATAGLFSPWTGVLAAIESCIASPRRATNPEHGAAEVPPPGHLQLHPGVAVLQVPRGSLVLYAHVLQAVGSDGALERVVKGQVDLSSLPVPDTSVEETLLLNPTRPDRGVGEIEPPLAKLLRLAEQSVDRGAFFHEMRGLGAEPREEEEVLHNLIKDGLLWGT